MDDNRCRTLDITKTGMLKKVAAKGIAGVTGSLVAG
jgi:hypothetical protein